MKIALLGSSPLATEAAIQFHSHGASLTWFNFTEQSPEGQFQDGFQDYTSELGLSLLKSTKKPSSYEAWLTEYHQPLVDLLKTEHRIRPHHVVSLSKRYLAPHETPKNTSRFHDLFRVIYEVNPQEFIKEQEESNPETYQRLTKEFVDSLQSNIEMYEDFDVVLDLRRVKDAGSVSVAGRALGESRVNKEHLLYGMDALKLAHKLNQDAQDMREIAIIGSEAMAAEIMLALKDWLKDQRSRLFIVSSEAEPFKHFMDLGNDSVVKDLRALNDYMAQEFEKDITDFHHKLREWQQMDDFVQAKIPRPAEPIPRLVYFSGHNATAVDQLIDKRRLFLTLEKPDFREGLVQPENNQLELKTIGVDRIFVATSAQELEGLEMHFPANEKGFFRLAPVWPTFKNAWAQDLKGLKGIEDEIFKLFSPTGTH